MMWWHRLILASLAITLLPSLAVSQHQGSSGSSSLALPAYSLSPLLCTQETVCSENGSILCSLRTASPLELGPGLEECHTPQRTASTNKPKWDPDRFATYVSWGGAIGTAAGLIYAVVDVRRNYSGSFVAFPVFFLDTTIGFAAGLGGGAAVYGVHLLIGPSR